MTENRDVPPPNPFYKRTYCTTITGGQAWVEIPAPGGVITPEDAEYLLQWFELIQRQLRRVASQDRPQADAETSARN